MPKKLTKKIAKKAVRKKTIKKKTSSKSKTSKKKNVGRPCLLDEKMHNTLVRLVAGGNYYSVACAACNISYDIFRLWMNEGRRLSKEYADDINSMPADRAKYFRFFVAIKKAEAYVETNVVAKILVDKDWKAQMTYLERKYPDRWGRTDRQKIEGEIKINVSKLTDQELTDVINNKYTEKK